MPGRHRDVDHGWTVAVLFVVLGIAAGLALFRGAVAEPRPQPPPNDHPCVDSYSVTPGGATWWSCAPSAPPSSPDDTPPPAVLPPDPFGP